ncbi:MAG: hypothetical protein JRI97_03855 [Deltaproteobacteria bacterium]|nr:hypothetical protein [Deltaproteobacteria bacterium]
MLAFLTGPMFWIALVVFVAGLAARGVWYVRGLNWQLDRVAYRAHPRAGIRGALRSIFYWLVPMGTRGWRVQPFMTVVFFVFHAGVVAIPLFLLAHTVFLAEKFGAWLPAMPQPAADVLAWAAAACIILLALRRIALPEVRILTDLQDWLILLLTAAPFVTGLFARYDAAGYESWMIAHVLSGEILLIAAPFTRLNHILLFFLSRAQLGADYGIKRGGLKGTDVAW